MTDVLIVGSGPAGLSCAIEAKKAGLSVLVLEQGGVADAIRRFPTNLVWFSTPELLEIGDVPFVSPSVRPTRVDTLNYYQKVAQYHRLDIRTFQTVTEIRKLDSGFAVGTAGGDRFDAETVILATGYFDCPNQLGIPGEEQPQVRHYYEEPFLYFGTDVVVIGGRNSAVEAALDLYRHGAPVALVHRDAKLSEGVKYWILPDIVNRIRQRQIAAFFSATAARINPGTVTICTPAGERELKADFVFVLVGFHPDTERLRSYGIRIDPVTLAPCVDAQTLETNVAGLYIAGSAVAGKDNNKIFVENGRLHAFQIIPAITSRLRTGG